MPTPHQDFKSQRFSASSTLLEPRQYIAELEHQLAQATVALDSAHAELQRLSAKSAIRVNSELRLVSAQPELIDAEVHPPRIGSRGFGLGKGGCLVPLTWTSSSHHFFKGYMPYPRVSEELKRKINEALYQRLGNQ